MESPWETWIRSLLLIVVAVGVGAAWYFDIIPDAYVGVPLGVGAVFVAAAMVWAHVRAAAPSPLLRRLGTAAIGAAVLIALWSPWRILGPGGEIVGADITEKIPSLTISPHRRRHRALQGLLPRDAGLRQ